MALTLCTNAILMGQQLTLAEAEEFADKLVRKEILIPKGKDLLLKQLAAKEIEFEHPSTVKSISYSEDDISRESILKFCSNAFQSSQLIRMEKDFKVEQKIKPEDTMRDAWTIHPSFSVRLFKVDGDCIHAKRSTIGLTRTRTLNDFKEIGLINDMVFQDCLEKLNDETINQETELLAYMTRRSIYYRYYDFNKKEQEEYIEELVNAGILTQKGQKDLLKSYSPLKLKTIPEILLYSTQYVFVDFTYHEPKPDIIYPLIFESLKKIIPGFNYSDLKVEVREEKDHDLVRQDIIVNFTAGGRVYSHLFFHNYRREVYDSVYKEIPPQKVDQDFHKGVNKWLTDIESPFRLYTVNIPDKIENPYSRSKKGLLLLKAGEAEKISTDAYVLSRESFDDRLSNKNIEKFINDLSAEGLFSHLTKEEIDTAKQKLAIDEIGSIQNLLLHFPKTIVFFDWETGNLENPYEELTNRLAQATRGLVTVTSIVDEYKKGWEKGKKIKSVKYGFTMNGRKYEAILPFKEDWLDPGFMELFKQALKDNKIDGDIYYCVDNGQEAGYIFLNPRQFQFIKTSYPDLVLEGEGK